jgi:hypothetical protein
MKNSIDHTCPPRAGAPEKKSKLAKTRWLADAIIDWLRETPSLGLTALIKLKSDKFNIKNTLHEDVLCKGNVS